MQRYFTALVAVRLAPASLVVAIVLAITLGCSSDPKKDAYKGQDKPVPDEKKDK